AALTATAPRARRGGRSFRSGQFRQARGIQFKAFNIQQPTAGMRQFRLGNMR
ncbi:hypothetical protein LTSEALA_2245, partial [Salmonella enterica subsp. enterica serovar Alachua str. R6-377]